MSLSEEYRGILNQAIDALHKRTFFAQYPEHPSPKVYGETADADGQEAFKAHLNKPFEEIDQHRESGWMGEETSPYLMEPLGITYPKLSAETLVERAHDAFNSWRKVSPDERAAVLIDSLEQVKKRFFEIAYATMHTTGQGYMMAFQASGPHAADRALEAIAAGYEELQRFPENATWDKPMGKYNITLSKSWRAVPKGIAVVIGCSTFPTWNSVPGIYANLMTGNPVIVKPHPGAVLPIAIFVSEITKSMKAAGHSIDACQLAIDSVEDPITKGLAEHPDIRIIDYTGNSEFGDYLENIRGKEVFTEKTGVNCVILDSAENVDKIAQNLAFSIALYSGQMCTAPQNIFIPEEGIKTSEGVVSFDEFAQKMVDNVNGLVDNPKAGPFVLGAIQNQKTCDRVGQVDKLKAKILLESRAIENPMFKNARTMTPALLAVDAQDEAVYSAELFGPVAFLIKTKDTKESLKIAQKLAREKGAISCGAYSTDSEMKELIADEMSLAGAPVSFNLLGGIYLNQHAAFSDFHVTGGNPAGNASFTNPEYVIRRFTWVGAREPV
jgi:phenylacetic acid degradation protein paaN